MADTTTAQMRIMLQGYEQQLLAARRLGKAVGQEVQFTYPPGGRLCIVGQGPEGPRPLSEEEQRRTRHVLWRITRQKVDQSMLEKPSGQ